MGFDLVRRKFTNIQATTGADGKYSFENLSAGSYFLFMTPKPGWKTTTQMFQRANLPAGGSIEVNFGVRK